MVVGAESLPAEALHEAFVDAFSDYLIGPFALGLDAWPGFLARQGADLALSRAAVDAQGQVLAFALVAPRPQAWRLATMGARPSARGQGHAQRLLDDVIAGAQAAGMASVELEVFAQNERAVALYRSRGFGERRVLNGWRHEALGGDGVASPYPALTRAEALAWLDALTLPDLPLQLGARVLAANPRPWTAWRDGRAQLVFDAQAERVQLLSLVDIGSPGQGDARRLVQALQRAYPVLPLVQPQLLPDELGGAALQSLGFGREPLHQLLLRRPV